MPDRIMSVLGVGCGAGSLAIIACFMLTPIAAEPKPPDWAAVWAMRWTAITAIFTGISALAIAMTALYAAHAIKVNTDLERVKAARELILRYEQNSIAQAILDCTNTDHCTNTDEKCLRRSVERFEKNYYKVIMYFEECALLYNANNVDREMLLRFLSARIVSNWFALNETAIPYFCKLYPEQSVPEFTLLRVFVQRAQAYLRQSADTKSELLEPLP